jgi:hypothetical protein
MTRRCRIPGIVAALSLAVGMLSGLSARPAQAFCSVFDRAPCAPTFCSALHRGVCIPEIDYPIGQDLQLTIESKTEPPKSPDGDLDTIAALFTALRSCWTPPQQDAARAGMEVSVRLSFKRSGDVIAQPRWTYTTPGAPNEARQTYRNSVTAALSHCTPLHLSKGLGGAIAGRPIAIRFVENRELPHKEAQP